MTGPPARTAPLLLVAAAAFLAGVLPLPAESDGRVVESVLLPPRFYVGDPVELRLRLEVPAGVEVAQPSVGQTLFICPLAGGTISTTCTISTTIVSITTVRFNMRLSPHSHRFALISLYGHLR